MSIFLKMWIGLANVAGNQHLDQSRVYEIAMFLQRCASSGYKSERHAWEN